MIHKPTLDALKQCIAKTEVVHGLRGPTAPSGASALDEALPGGGFSTGAVHELLPAAHGDFAAALGFGVGLLTCLTRVRPGFILWTLPAHELFRQGALYPLGLSAQGLDPNRIIQVRVPKTQNVLWVLEEALGQSSVSAVMGLLPRDDRTYDFTASRRLALRAAQSGVTALLIQDHLALDSATAADMRWRIAATPSVPLSHHGQSKPGLGPPRWNVELTKSKRGPAGHWRVKWDHETLSFRMAASLVDRTPLRTPRPSEYERNWAVAS